MSWVHLSDTTPKARKSHRCCLCGLEIAKGQLHVARRGIMEGEGRVTQRMHTDCEAVTATWREEDWENGVDEAGFRQEKEEFYLRKPQEAGT